MKVNAVDSIRFNNVHFEGKKNKEIQSPVHTTSPIKAIPVAVLLAMSPLNAPVAQTQNVNTTEVTQKTEQPLVVIATYDYKNATPKNENCYMEFFGKNIDADEVEKLRLNFIQKKSNYIVNMKDSTSRRYNYQHCTVIDINELEKKTITYVDSDCQLQTRTEYYAWGPGHIYDTPGVYADTNEPIVGNVHIKKFPRLKKVITPEFYNTLKDMMGDDLQYKTTYESK